MSDLIRPSYLSAPKWRADGQMTIAVATLIFARESLGLTQRSLAAKMGIAASTIAEFETLKRQPNWEILCRYADAVGMRMTLGVVDKKEEE